MVLEPGGIIAWIVVGLIAGWLTGKVVRGGGYGVLRDMDALTARLKEHHIPWLREPKDEGWGIEAFVTDPDGYQWAIVAPSHHGRWWVWPLNRLAAF